MKTNKMLAGFGLLTTALPSVVFAQVINRPSNELPTTSAPPSNNNTLLIVAGVVVVAIIAFFIFRSKGKS
jgi:LPXTG-motif cell wall-anchored protein